MYARIHVCIHTHSYIPCASCSQTTPSPEIVPTHVSFLVMSSSSPPTTIRRCSPTSVMVLPVCVCVCVCVCVWCVPAHSTIRLNIQAMHGERNENHLLAPPRTRIAHSRTARPIVAMHWHLLARARRQRFPNGLDLCSDHAWCHCPYLSSPVNLPSFLLYLAALTLEFHYRVGRGQKLPKVTEIFLF